MTTPGKITWAIITGEYPPQHGGVSDYSWSIAHALAAYGDEVHVFAPVADSVELSSSVHIHRLSGFGLLGIFELIDGLGKLPKPRRAILQFVVQSFGMRGANIPFGIAMRFLRGYPLWVMFHEFAIADDARESIPRRVLACLTRIVARLVDGSADLALMSTPAWREDIARYAPTGCSIIWSPVPSNIPTEIDGSEKQRIDASIRDPSGGAIIGHFGTYRMAESLTFLGESLPALLRADPKRRVLLLGRGSSEFMSQILAKLPDLTGRLFSADNLMAQDMANHIAICDVLLQTYPDGITTRRSSAISALALGAAIVTAAGSRTEDIWRQSDAVFLSEGPSTKALIAAVEAALKNDERRQAISRNAIHFYRRYFTVDRVIEQLRAVPI